MSKLAWLTVDTLPSTIRILSFMVPDDDTWLAQLRGALVPLTYEENFEEFGAVTPRDNADWWRCFVLEFFEEKSVIYPGMIMPYGGVTPPDGWLLCDGQQFLVADYPLLFAVIGWTFNPGLTDSDYFAVPDMGERFPVGYDQNHSIYGVIGAAGGEDSHTLTQAEMPVHTHIQDQHYHGNNAHNHTQDSHGHDFYSRSSAGTSATPFHPVITTRASVPNQQSPQSVAGTVATNQPASVTIHNTIATNQNAGSGNPHNNLPPFLTLNYLIKT